MAAYQDQHGGRGHRALTLLFIAGFEGSGHHWPWRAALRTHHARVTFKSDPCLTHAFWHASVSANASARRRGEQSAVGRLRQLSQDGGTYVLNGARGQLGPVPRCEPGVDIPLDVWRWSKGGRSTDKMGQMSYPSFGRSECMPSLPLLRHLSCSSGARLAVAVLARHPGEAMVSTSLRRKFKRGDARAQAAMLEAGAAELNRQLVDLTVSQRQRSACPAATVEVFDFGQTLGAPAEAGRRLARACALPERALGAAFEEAVAFKPGARARTLQGGLQPRWLAEARQLNASSEWLAETHALIARLACAEVVGPLFARTPITNVNDDC